MMKNLKLVWVPLLLAEGAFAGLPPGGLPPGDGASQAQHRRGEVRQAVAAQPGGRESAGAGERRLTPQERAELRQQIRDQGRLGRDADGRR